MAGCGAMAMWRRRKERINRKERERRGRGRRRRPTLQKCTAVVLSLNMLGGPLKVLARFAYNNTHVW